MLSKWENCSQTAHFSATFRAKSRYRAPEVMLRSKNYGPAVDLWALGAILIELINLSPAFPGESELDQLFRIAHVLGSPSELNWPEGVELMKKLNLEFKEVIASFLPPKPLSKYPLLSDNWKGYCGYPS